MLWNLKIDENHQLLKRLGPAMAVAENLACICQGKSKNTGQTILRFISKLTKKGRYFC